MSAARWHAETAGGLTWEGEATSSCDAAERALEAWYERGAWSGEAVPTEVEVTATNENDPGCAWHVAVAVNWEPTFTARWPRGAK